MVLGSLRFWTEESISVEYDFVITNKLYTFNHPNAHIGGSIQIDIIDKILNSNRL